MHPGRAEYPPVLRVVSGAAVESPLVLFLPGLSGDTTQWDVVLPRLAASDVTVAYGAPILPNPAFVGSPPTVTELARLLAAEIQRVGYSSVIVVAHSVGAFVAFALCGLIPRHVGSAVIINGGLTTVARFFDRPATELRRNPRTCLNALRLFVLAGMPAPNWLKRAVMSNRRASRMLLGNLIGSQTFASEKQLAAIVEHSGSLAVLRALWDNRHHWSEFERYAGTISADVTFIVGDLDPVGGEADARAMAVMLPHASIMISPGAGHVAPVETADAVAEMVLRSLPAKT